jgi:hypothetical protein
MEALEQKSVVRKSGKQKTFHRGDKVTIQTYLNGFKRSDYVGEATYELGVRTIDKNFCMMGKYLSAPTGEGSIGWLAVRYDAEFDETDEVFICERDLRGWKETDENPATGNTYYYVVCWD